MWNVHRGPPTQPLLISDHLETNCFLYELLQKYKFPSWQLFWQFSFLEKKAGSIRGQNINWWKYLFTDWGGEWGGGRDKGKQLSKPYNCLLNKTPFDLMTKFLKRFPSELSGIIRLGCWIWHCMDVKRAKIWQKGRTIVLLYYWVGAMRPVSSHHKLALPPTCPLTMIMIILMIMMHCYRIKEA